MHCHLHNRLNLDSFMLSFAVKNRLFNYGIGIHLLKCEDPDKMPSIYSINPKDNHISFQVFLSLAILCIICAYFPFKGI